MRGVDRVDPYGMPVNDATLLAARVMLRGGSPPDLAGALKLSRQLKGKQQFGLARRVLERAREHPALTAESNRERARQLVQQQALCQSKDTSLPYRRHEDALQLLKDGADLESTTDKETLGIAGGILKRMWARSGQTRFLIQGLSCYERGYSSSSAPDDYGYNGINAAFLNEQLASEDDPRSARERCQKALRIRETLAERLQLLLNEDTYLAGQWWYLITVAEAFLGLHRYQDAARWLSNAQGLSVDDWEREASATQLVELSRLHNRVVKHLPTSLSVGAPARSSLEVVREAFPRVPVADLGLKLGLALSGGGFRASLYHIGVLARLADEDELRRVEVLSCVSGGSIVGTHYYLELRSLLERKPDGEITREDYIEVVRHVAKGFLAGVKRNIRTRVLASPTASLAILLSDQTRTKYLGDLFESELFVNVDDKHDKGEPRWINDLLVRPKGEPEDFHPRSHNWRRRAKVPLLILNATTLNTGHLWQFTATWMGEPPGPINPTVDLRERLRRLYYRDAPPAFKRIRLGQAVAASACVPGLFEPLALDGLYPNRSVRLVDGGVFDNVGIEGLLAEDCLQVVVSDASGPLTAEADVAAGRIGAPVRSNSIGMSLVRDRQWQSLWALKGAGSLRGLLWVHLAQDVKGGATVDWTDCADASETRMAPPRQILDEKIAAIRTDLDCFSDAEACVLMTKGYRMIEKVLTLERATGEWPPPGGEPPRQAEWPFLAVEAIMNKAPGYERAHDRLLRLLGAANRTLFKLWWIVPGLKPVSAALALSALYWAFTCPGSLPAIPLRTIAEAAVAAGAIAILLSRIRRVIRTQASLGALLITFLALVAWIPARLQLHVFDRVFLRLGTLDRLRPG